jgi:hypothetical protein
MVSDPDILDFFLDFRFRRIYHIIWIILLCQL